MSRKQAFLNTLSQGPFWAGDKTITGETLCEAYFYGYIPYILKEIRDLKQELVERHDNDECSGTVFTVWRFTFEEASRYRSFSGATKLEEEVFFLKFFGFYRSHEGSEYERFSEVTPSEKTVTVYE